jgi:hypothetical protein
MPLHRTCRWKLGFDVIMLIWVLNVSTPSENCTDPVSISLIN